MDYFLFNFSGVQFHYTMSRPIKITTLKDFWTAKTRDDYISMLSVAVEKE